MTAVSTNSSTDAVLYTGAFSLPVRPSECERITPATVGRAASTHRQYPSGVTMHRTTESRKSACLICLTLMCTIVLLPLVHVVAQIREPHTSAASDSIVVGRASTCA